jgi:hypothetical protein
MSSIRTDPHTPVSAPPRVTHHSATEEAGALPPLPGVGREHPGPTPNGAPTRVALAIVVPLLILGTGLAAAVGLVILSRAVAEADLLRREADRLSLELRSLELEPADTWGWDDHGTRDDHAGWEDHGGWDDAARPLFETGASEEPTYGPGETSFRFELSPDQLLEVRARRTADGGPWMELIDEQGRWHASAGYDQPGLAPDTDVVLWHPARTESAYILVVYGDEPGTGQLAASLHEAWEAATVVEFEGPYPRDEVPTFTFEGQAGQLAVVSMTDRSHALDPLVLLFDPEGQLLGQDDDGGGGLDAQLVVELPADGRYEVEARTFDGGLPEPGGREPLYELHVELLEVP